MIIGGTLTAGIVLFILVLVLRIRLLKWLC